MATTGYPVINKLDAREYAQEIESLSIYEKIENICRQYKSTCVLKNTTLPEY